MTYETAAMPRYCQSCGGQIAWQEATWVINHEGRLEYYHVGCELGHGYAVVPRHGEDQKR